MWLNEEDELQHSVRGRQISGTILNLSRPSGTSTEQQKLLQDLAQVASALFSERGAFPDPIVGRPDSLKSTNEASTRPVNPDELVLTLAELAQRNRKLGGNAAPVPGLPLVGVMRVLFPPIDEFRDDELGEESDEEKQQREGEQPDQRASDPPSPTEPPPERFRKRLILQVDKFLLELAKPEFANSCTATQLVQAAAFPLAVAVKAHEGRWIDQVTANRWAFRVTDILFRVLNPANGDSYGLLAAVRERYKREGRLTTFAKIVGDGRLWIATAAALHRNREEKNYCGLDHALALADIYHEPMLWNTADPSRIQVLLSRLDSIGAGKSVLLAASTMASIVRNVEERLNSKCAYYFDQQLDDDHAKGDPLWRNGMGFGWAEQAAAIEKGAHLDIYLRKRGKKITVGSIYYVNLRVATKHDSKLARLLDQVAPCWPGHMPKE